MQRLILCLLLLGGLAARAAQPFFPFCIDWHDAKKRNFTEQAAMLKELGYDGVGHIWLDKVAERLQSLDAAGLKLYQITMTVNVAAGKTPFNQQQFKEVLTLVKGRHVQLLLIFEGAKPADGFADQRAVALIREMSEQARAADASLLLYPHTGNWIERIEDAVRVADLVDRPNVGVMFNLCHWLRVCPDRDYRTRLQRALPRLQAVSINGADEHDSQPGWDRYIQPLDRGSFDVGALLRTLRDLGYQGPIGLQCYGIGGDVREHLARSSAAWRRLQAGLAEAPPAAADRKKVLIVTGRDLHDWKATTPVLRAALAADARLAVTVTEDAKFLAAPELKTYDVVVLHYMNWQDPGPGAAALEGLRQAVTNGTGLVLVHFACGAFQGWPEFVNIAGRVWAPKLRPHDPRGKFQVRFTDVPHPVTAGLKAFEVDDELYTCLTGDTPIHLLATARSVVDQKDYPMAFTLTYGRGRVFHCVLGHDERALSIPTVGQLFRRGCAWTAGLKPVE
ncbi:MAG: ThuA domain-containing protein [Kiritimatiellaeota bacterium]|nr:ThuA domain-containing protein [Kiritimatiellota bacterium]